MVGATDGFVAVEVREPALKMMTVSEDDI